MNDLARELEERFGNRAVDGLWCNVPARIMLQIIQALRHTSPADAKSDSPKQSATATNNNRLSDADWVEVVRNSIRDGKATFGHEISLGQILTTEELTTIAQAAISALAPLMVGEREKERASIVAFLKRPRGALQPIIDDYARAIQSAEHLNREGE